jgi:hypothetical protein
MVRSKEMDKAARFDHLVQKRKVKRVWSWRLLSGPYRAMFGGKAGQDALLSRVMDHVDHQRWGPAGEDALELGRLAERSGDNGLMRKAARILRRLDHPQQSWELFSKSMLVPGKPEWDGSSLAGKTIVVERREGDIAIFLQFASLLQPLAREAGRCIVLAEPRVAPLYRRSFPDLDVRIEGTSGPIERADCYASFETLAMHAAKHSPAGTWAFHPLLPEMETAAALRKRYEGELGCSPIGIAWGSLNKTKSLPSLQDWSVLLRQLPAGVLSLQYGDVTPTLQWFAANIPHPVLHDDSVNQLVDLDLFAAQLASLDLVVTVSNTGAHLAGALGVPCLLVFGDEFQLSWPAFGSNVATYPSMEIIRRAERPWADVFAEIASKIAVRGA